MGPDERRQRDGIACPSLFERIPAPTVQHRRRRTAQPDAVAVGDAEDREQDAEQVADQRCVEPDEPLAADERDRNEDGNADDAPGEASAIQAIAWAGHGSHPRRAWCDADPRHPAARSSVSSVTTNGKSTLFSLWMCRW